MTFINYVVFAVSICFISWVVAIVANGILVKTPLYKKLENLHFIQNKNINKLLLVDCVKWVILNTFFKYFNQSIKLTNQRPDLHALRHEMTLAEVSHLIGFLFVFLIAAYKSVVVSPLMGLIIMFFNLLMNLCPSLIQQDNKRRIDRLIKRSKTANDAK